MNDKKPFFHKSSQFFKSTDDKNYFFVRIPIKLTENQNDTIAAWADIMHNSCCSFQRSYTESSNFSTINSQ